MRWDASHLSNIFKILPCRLKNLFATSKVFDLIHKQCGKRYLNLAAMNIFRSWSCQKCLLKIFSRQLTKGDTGFHWIAHFTNSSFCIFLEIKNIEKLLKSRQNSYLTCVKKDFMGPDKEVAIFTILIRIRTK